MDDHRLFAQALSTLLAGRGFDVVGTPSTGLDALRAVRDMRPDVVLMDVGLPDGSGIAVAVDILGIAPKCKILLLTALGDPRLVREASKAGLHGYVLKSTKMTDLLEVIEAALGGKTVPSPRIPRAVTFEAHSEPGHAALLAAQLTGREREILVLLSEALTSRQIAERLVVSISTVRTHVQAILGKLQVHSRLEAVAFAVRFDIVDLPSLSFDDAVDEPPIARDERSQRLSFRH